MKKVLLSIIGLLLCGYVSAQKNYEKSDAFPEFDGWTKLIQLRNGNTGLMEVTKGTGINFTLLNPQRKKVTSGKLPLKKMPDKLELAQIVGVYDISGDYVAFIISGTEEKKRLPILFRIIVDGSTGKLKTEEEVDQLTEMNMGDAFGMVYGDTDIPTFVVEKDPESDHYAVIKYNSLVPEAINRIQVSHFGPDHKVINKANYNTPTDKYKFTKFLAAYVNGSEYVLIGTSAFNTKKSGGDEIRYYVAQLNNGKTTFLQKELQYTFYDKKARCNFVYNKPKGFITMILRLENGGQVNQNINPTSMALENPYIADWTNIDKMYKEQFGNKKGFKGVLQGSFIDSKGNITYLYQGMIKETRSSGYGQPAQVVATIFGDVALVTMSPEGKEISSTIFTYSVHRSGDHDAFSYNNARKGMRINGGFTKVADNDWYKGMDFISTDNGSYLFFNNRLDNMDRPDKDEAARISGISGTAGVKYTYKDGKITKEYVLAKPATKKDAKFINPGSSDYNAATKTYATIITDPETKKCNVVWTKID